MFTISPNEPVSARFALTNKKECTPVSMRVRFKSRQPCRDIQFGQVHVVFPATRTDMKLILKADPRQYDAFIEADQKSAIT